ncbi:hypothetical protein SB780_41590, partial [Burkholderia sp. SIMBA_057]
VKKQFASRRLRAPFFVTVAAALALPALWRQREKSPADFRRAGLFRFRPTVRELRRSFALRPKRMRVRPTPGRRAIPGA